MSCPHCGCGELPENVTILKVVTRLDLAPERILQAAIGKLQTVTLVGTTLEGDEYFASSIASGPGVLWDLERAKLRLLTIQTDTPLD